MATTYKILGQVTSAQTATSLYTVPSATQAVIDTTLSPVQVLLQSKSS